jgi:hypothetical protein
MSKPIAPPPGLKRGRRGAGDRPLTWWADQQDPRSGQCSRPTGRLRPDAGQHCRHLRRCHVARRYRPAKALIG